jgi:hypothetical protein
VSASARFVGRDVDEVTIAVGVTSASGDPARHGRITNDACTMNRWMKRLSRSDLRLQVASEADATRRIFSRRLNAMGFAWRDRDVLALPAQARRADPDRRLRRVVRPPVGM